MEGQSETSEEGVVALDEGELIFGLAERDEEEEVDIAVMFAWVSKQRKRTFL